jgi:hypothetical protein
VDRESVELDERIRVDQSRDAFTRGQFGSLVLTFVGRFACRRRRLGTLRSEMV